MNEKIDQAISNLLAKIRANVSHDEALKYSQAALNLANAKHTLASAELMGDEFATKFRTEGAGA